MALEEETDEHAEIINTLEKESILRRERLQKWRRDRLTAKIEKDTAGKTEIEKNMVFRSYATDPDLLKTYKKTAESSHFDMLPEAIADATAISHKGPTDMDKLVPGDVLRKKAPQDDAIRYIQPKLELLKLRTEKAMFEYLRSQLGQSHNVDLLSAVHVGSALVYGEHDAEHTQN